MGKLLLINTSGIRKGSGTLATSFKMIGSVVEAADSLVVKKNYLTLNTENDGYRAEMPKKDCSPSNAVCQGLLCMMTCL